VHQVGTLVIFIYDTRTHIRQMGNVSDKSCKENQIALFVSNDFFINRAVYEIMWKNCVEPGGLRMTIRRMRVSRRVPKATNTHYEYVILFFHCHNSCTNVPQCYTYIAYIVNLKK
jgi:hypothetical protein